MTTPTWEEASTPIDATTYRDDLLASLEEEGATVNGWSDDAPQRALVEGESRALAAESDIIAGLAQTASPITCSAAGTTWVDAVIGWFNLQNADGTSGRLLATRAVWAISLKITTSAAPITIDATNASGIQLQAATGVIFLCTQESAVTLNAGSGYIGTVEFTARVAGTTGNVSPGQITKVIAGPAGLTVDLDTTQVRTLTARNDESDASLITRALGQWGRLGAGWTVTAYDYLIPFFGNTSTTSVTRWSIDDSNPLGAGSVAIYLADAAGPASAATVTAVNTGLQSRDVKPVGSGLLSVGAAAPHDLALTIELITDGTNPNVGTQAAAALQELQSVYPIGPSNLETDLLRAILMGGEFTSISVYTGATRTQIPISLPGYSGVIQVSALSMTIEENIGSGEVLVFSPAPVISVDT